MNVSKLFDLTHWVTDEIVATKIPQKYQALKGMGVRPTQLTPIP